MKKTELKLKSLQISKLIRNSFFGIFGIFSTSFVIIFFAWNLVPHRYLIIWLALIQAMTLTQFIFVTRFHMIRQSMAGTLKWGMFFTLWIGIFGAAIGSVAFFITFSDSTLLLAFIMVFIFGMVSASTVTMSVYIWSYFSFSSLTLLPMVLLLLSSNDSMMKGIGYFGIVYYLSVSGLAVYIYKETSKTLGLLLENQSLQKRLRLESIGKRAAQNKLKEVRFQYQHILDSAPMAIVTIDRAGHIIYVNEKLVTLLGSPSLEKAMEINMLHFPRLQEFGISGIFQKALDSGQTLVEEKEYVSKWGKKIFFRVHVSVIRDLNGQVIGATGITEDVTSVKEYQSKLSQARLEAEKALQVKTQFLATMSHEIRTPMNVIIGMNELALKTNDPDEQKEFLTLVQKSADHLLVLINDILDYSKIESGKLELYREPVSLFADISETISFFSLFVKEKRLALHLEYDEKIPATIITDASRLKQVMINLINNAVKFTDKGSINVSLSLIHIDEQKQSALIRFCVADTGPGIKPDQQKIIFESFYQSDSKTRRKHGGTGLGLTIAKNIVAIMGGELQVESSPRKGSAFFFELEFPILSQRAQDIKMEMNPGEKPKKTWHILIAEDNAVNARLLEVALSKEGHTLAIAKTGKEALTKLKKRPFDVVLMDIEMPEMDGLEAALCIRKGEAGEKNRTIPIIALSAHASAEFKELSRKAAMDGFIPKPVKLSALNSSINAIIVKTQNQMPT